MTATLVLADDSALFRGGLATLLGAAGLSVLAEARDLAELMLEVAMQRPAVAVVDVRMPPTWTDEGIEAALRIRAEYPATAVLVLSTYADPTWAKRLFREGSASLGYLLKDRVDDVRSLVDAITRIADGGSAVDPEIVAQLVETNGPTGVAARLTERERGVLTAMAEGLSNAGIARRMYLSEKTVETHINGVFLKLGLSTADRDVNRRVLAVLKHLEE